MIRKQLKKWYGDANRFSGGRLDILKNALESFADTRASQAAAGLAYYAFFSLFPLLLVLIAGGSYFLNSQQVYQNVIQFLQATIPVSTQVINENLRQVLDVRGTVGIIGLLTLLWSASGVFTNLAYSINLAWPGAPRRNFLEKRLVGLGMIAGLSGLLILSLALDGITNLAPFLNSDSASLNPGPVEVFLKPGILADDFPALSGIVSLGSHCGDTLESTVLGRVVRIHCLEGHHSRL